MVISNSARHQPSEPYLLGIDGGTESVRVGVFDTTGHALAFASEPYALRHPRPGWAEQNPDQWWSSFVVAVRRAIAESGVRPEAIAGICFDATSCSVVALDASDCVLRPALIWMDVRAVDQAHRIASCGQAALKYNGYSNVSAEWMPCKVLWLKEHEPETYHAARRICEYGDWMVHRLTGEWTASINTSSIRAYYDRSDGGWPADFYASIGLDDALARFPQRVLDMGAVAGCLTRQAAAELGLPAQVPVAEGGADAFVAMVGLDVLAPGKLALITGSSHLLLGQVAEPIHGKGFFGAYTDAVLPGQWTVEGGQVSTGSVVKWFKDGFAGGAQAVASQRGVSSYQVLDEYAAAVPPGSEGLVALDYWQGNRTPYVDSEARGMLWGLSLKHGPGHVFRAIVEGVCYGTEHILQTLKSYGCPAEQIVACGGATKSRLWMQIHADVSGVPIEVTAEPEAASLGSAILAAVGAGIYPDPQTAARHMVRVVDRIQPDPAQHAEYQFYVDKYIATYARMADLMHEVARHVAVGKEE